MKVVSAQLIGPWHHELWTQYNQTLKLEVEVEKIGRDREGLSGLPRTEDELGAAEDEGHTNANMNG
jgi:hypothetical protein